MQVQILTHGEQTREYAVIFSKGDEAISGMLDFAEKYHITSGHFTATGVLNGTRLAWFDPQRKRYKKIPIDSQSKCFRTRSEVTARRIVGHIEGNATRPRPVARSSGVYPSVML